MLHDKLEVAMSVVYRGLMQTLSVTGIKKIWHWKKRLEREEKLPESKMNQIIDSRLNMLFRNLHNCTYYQQIIEEHIDSKSSSLLSLQDFPILTKEIIRSKLDNGLLANTSKSRARLDSTSGSTGVPLQFAKDMNNEDIKLATEILFSEYTGWIFGQKQAHLWGEHHESLVSKIWKHYILRTKQFPPYLQSDSAAKSILHQIKRWNPKLLTGYSSALYSFADFFEQTNLLHELSAIIASAEALYSYQKKSVETTFGSPVFMRYGSRELDNVAMECPERDGYHILRSRYIVEILDDHNQPVREGKIGHLVVTDLMNHVMPFVRYDTGDEASVSFAPCACGRSSPRLKELRGRTCDYIEVPSKNKVPALRFNVLFEQLGGVIHEFQIVQKTPSSIQLKVVPGRHFTQEWNMEQMKTIISTILLDEMDIEIEIVDSIPRTKAGKLRYIIPLD